VDIINIVIYANVNMSFKNFKYLDALNFIYTIRCIKSKFFYYKVDIIHFR
jgi:hypothetical protein